MADPVQTESAWKTAPWIGWCITVILFAIKLWWDRKKPRKIVCRQIRITSLVEVGSNVKDRIKVLFDDHEVRKPALAEFHITNNSDQTITNITLKLEFYSDLKILEATSIRLPFLEPNDIACTGEKLSNQVYVQIPYLNPHKEGSQRVYLACLCDGEYLAPLLSGGGEGWFSQSQDAQASKRHINEKITNLVLVMIISLLSSYAIKILFEVPFKSILIAGDWKSLGPLKTFLPRLALAGIQLVCAGLIASYIRKLNNIEREAEYMHGIFTDSQFQAQPPAVISEDLPDSGEFPMLELPRGD